MWRLPHLPVAIDGRGFVHGDQVEHSISVWNGGRDWASDSELTAARLIFAGANQPLASLLRTDSRFELVYEDKVAAVFVAREASPQYSTHISLER